MLRQALRRVLWLGPTLVLVTLLAFWALSPRGPQDAASTRMPLFVNPAPADVTTLSQDLVDRVAREASDDDAARELAALGGAALPHVLPRLDALGTEARTRVALALAPIAERMSVARGTDHRDARTTLRFWDRFWQDRAIDFHPVGVRRAVRRAVERPSAFRDAEVRAFDTYALPELMAALGDAHATRNVAAISHITRLAAHARERPDWVAPPGATEARALAFATLWLDDWAEHEHLFVAFRGTARVFAVVSETEYGRFVTRLARTFTETATRLAPRAKVTLGLMSFTLVVGHLLGLAFNAFALSRRRGITVLAAGLFVGVLAVPWPWLAWAALLFGGSSWWTAAATMALLSASLVAVHERPTLRNVLAHPAFFARRVMGETALMSSIRASRASMGPLAARLATEVPVVLTICLVFEKRFDLEGLGGLIVPALQQHDVDVLMLVVIATTVLVGLVHLVTDLLLGVLAARNVLARRKIGILQ